MDGTRYFSLCSREETYKCCEHVMVSIVVHLQLKNLEREKKGKFFFFRFVSRFIEMFILEILSVVMHHKVINVLQMEKSLRIEGKKKT